MRMRRSGWKQLFDFFVSWVDPFFEGSLARYVGYVEQQREMMAILPVLLVISVLQLGFGPPT